MKVSIASYIHSEIEIENIHGRKVSKHRTLFETLIKNSKHEESENFVL